MPECGYCGYKYGHHQDCARPVNPPNPKQRYGDEKVPLGLFPSSALVYGTLAFKEGADKYGPYNWRDKAVEAMTYAHAAERHLRAWLDREDIDPSSGYPHLGHVLACISILVDATEQGNLIDNRPLAGSAARVLEEGAAKIRANRQDAETNQETFGPLNGAEVLGLNEKPYEPTLIKVERIEGNDEHATITPAVKVGWQEPQRKVPRPTASTGRS